MTKKSRPRRRGDVGRVLDVRFVEVAFVAPVDARIVMELEVEGGLRLLLADERAVPLAAAMLDALAAIRGRKGGRQLRTQQLGTVRRLPA